MAKEAIGIDIVNTKAASTFQNCECQCDSDAWTDGREYKGNCRSKHNGALFCYVSGSALCACRDVQCSSFLLSNNGQLKHFSYEACVTPPRNQCSNSGYGQQNFGDGDFPYCRNRKKCPRLNRPSYSTGGGRPGGSSNYGGGRPGGSSNYGGGRPGGSSNYGGGRPGGSSNYGGCNPICNPPRNSGKPTLNDYLSGIRSRENIGGSSDRGSSRGEGGVKFPGRA